MALLDKLAQLGVPLADLTADSRAVKLGSIFVAYPGTAQDGRAYIAEAIARGAAAVIWETRRLRWNEAWEVPNLGVENLRSAHLGDRGPTSTAIRRESLWMAGVTGTNGKTSVSSGSPRRSTRAGGAPAVIGTLGNGLVGERAEASEHHAGSDRAAAPARRLPAARRAQRRDGGVEPRPGPGTRRGHQVRRGASSPTSRATTSTTTARWRPTARRRRGSSRRAA